jgi:hypothetical protein
LSWSSFNYDNKFVSRVAKAKLEYGDGLAMAEVVVSSQRLIEATEIKMTTNGPFNNDLLYWLVR